MNAEMLRVRTSREDEQRRGWGIELPGPGQGSGDPSFLKREAGTAHFEL